MIAELYGLVLSGGHSRRMQRDKAGLVYDGKVQLARTMELLSARVARSFVSIREDQRDDPLRGAYQCIVDEGAGLGPIGGIRAAQHAHPDKAWLVLACDLPYLDGDTLDRLIAGREATRLATAYRSRFNGLPEPLCAIFEPASRAEIARWIEQGEPCPRKFLSAHAAAHAVRLLDLVHSRALDNINTPEEYATAQSDVNAQANTGAPPEPLRRVHVHYFALLREQAGRSSEELETPARTALELYHELRRRRGLGLDPSRLRVAVNDEFGDWQTPLEAGDRVAFLPPVAGG